MYRASCASVELFLRKIFFFLPENMIENIVTPEEMEEAIKEIIQFKMSQ